MDTELFQLSVIRLAPYAELADAVRGCGRLEALRRLATWTGPGRKLTKRTGALGVTEARKAMRDLHLRDDKPALGRNYDFTELQDLWEIACAAELVVDDDGCARPGPGFDVLEDDEDREIVDVWVDVFCAALERALWPPELSQAVHAHREGAAGRHRSAGLPGRSAGMPTG